MRKVGSLLLAIAFALGLVSCGGDPFFSHLQGDGQSPLDPVGRWNVNSSWSDGKTDKMMWHFYEDHSVQRETGSTGTWNQDENVITIRFEAESLLYLGTADLITMHGDVIAPARRGTWKATRIGP